MSEKVTKIIIKRGATQGTAHMFIVRVIFESYLVSQWVYSIEEALDFIQKETTPPTALG